MSRFIAKVDKKKCANQQKSPALIQQRSQTSKDL
jgi:hypothetical protein